MAARRASKGRNGGGKVKAAEVAAIEEEDVQQGSSLTVEDGLQIATFFALIGACAIMIFQLLPRYAENV